MFASDITVIGCAGCPHELFDHSAVRQLDAAEKGVMQETCVTVTRMKLCWQVLCLTGEAEFAAHKERSLYNALPGAVNSDCATVNGGLPFDSYSPLLPGLCGRQMGGCKPMENGTYCGRCFRSAASAPPAASLWRTARIAAAAPASARRVWD